MVCLAVVLLVVVGFAFASGLGTLCAAGIGSVAALCPLGALESLLASKLAIPRVLVTAVCMLALVALLGRAFCAWVCPVPPVQRFFCKEKSEGEPAACGQVEKGEDCDGDSQVPVACVCGVEAAAGAEAHGALSEKREDCVGCGGEAKVAVSCGGCTQCLKPVGGKRDGVQLDSRHAVLAGALASSAVFGFPVFCLACPVGLTFATLISLWRAIVDHNPTWMLLVFPVILLLELVVFRKWCHTLCPMGALMSLVGAKAPVGKPQVDDGACLRSQGVDCHACTSVCPEGLDPHSKTLAECTRCGLCVEHCPAGAIKLALLPGGRQQRVDVLPEGQGESQSERGVAL